jgi:hypothetical protein
MGENIEGYRHKKFKIMYAEIQKFPAKRKKRKLELAGRSYPLGLGGEPRGHQVDRVFQVD